VSRTRPTLGVIFLRVSWFKGKTTMAHRDGTYDVEHDDGDMETDVAAELIRLEAPKVGTRWRRRVVV
jgi:hypothetical protein